MSNVREIDTESYIDTDNRFKYHPPIDESSALRHEAVREIHKDVAEWAVDNIQGSRELSLAITKLEESMFWMNAAIARVNEDGERK